MSMKKISAFVAECNGCGKTALTLVENELPMGWFRGTVEEQTQSGPVSGSYLTCGIRCIRKAVDEVTDAKPIKVSDEAKVDATV